MSKLARIVVAGIVVALSAPSSAMAHANPRLEEAIAAASAATLASYERSTLDAQIANVLHGLGDGGRATELIDSAAGMAGRMPPGLMRDDAHAAIANEAASTGRFDLANELAARIADGDTSIKLGWKLAAKLAKAGRKEEASALLAGIRSRIEDVADPLRRTELLTGTGAAYKAVDPAEGRDLVREALRIAKDAPFSLPVRATLYNEIGANLMDVGQRREAMDTFVAAGALALAIGDARERAEVMAMLGGEMAEKGEREPAAFTLEQGVTAARELPLGEARDAVMSELARNFSQSRKFKRAMEVAGDIRSPYHRAEGLVRIAKNLARNGHEDDAKAILHSTTGTVGRIGSPYRQGVILRKLAAEWGALKDMSQARVLLDRALSIRPEVL